MTQLLRAHDLVNAVVQDAFEIPSPSLRRDVAHLLSLAPPPSPSPNAHVRVEGRVGVEVRGAHGWVTVDTSMSVRDFLVRVLEDAVVAEQCSMVYRRILVPPDETPLYRIGVHDGDTVRLFRWGYWGLTAAAGDPAVPLPLCVSHTTHLAARDVLRVAFHVHDVPPTAASDQLWLRGDIACTAPCVERLVPTFKRRDASGVRCWRASDSLHVARVCAALPAELRQCVLDHLALPPDEWERGEPIEGVCVATSDYAVTLHPPPDGWPPARRRVRLRKQPRTLHWMRHAYPLLDLEDDVVVHRVMGARGRFRTWHLHGVAEGAAVAEPGVRTLFLSHSDA
jgi:hypothetical protein